MGAPGSRSSSTADRLDRRDRRRSLDPNIIYVGSGEGLHRPDLSVGDGIYKSTDAGKTWTHLGLRDGQQISMMAVDPHDPNRLFVAVAGHPYGPNPERGIFRSTDGGQSFQKVLYKDENIGGNDVDIDPSDPDIVYAMLWEAAKVRGKTQPGTERAEASTNRPTAVRPGSSSPAGCPKTSSGLDGDRAEQSQAAVRHGRRKDAGELYRSEDAGATWSTVTTDSRPATRIGGGDVASRESIRRIPTSCTWPAS